MSSFRTDSYVKDPADVSAMAVALTSANDGVVLAVTDAQGRTTGVAAPGSSPQDQIPGAAYFDDGPLEEQTTDDTTAQFVYVPQPGTANYTITSTGVGAYTEAVDGESVSGLETPTTAFTGSVSALGPNRVTANSANGLITFPQETPEVNVTDAGGVANGSPYTATASITDATGSTGPTLEGVGLQLTYYTGSTVSGTGSPAAPTDPGTYTVVATFAGSTHYTSASDQATFTISPATQGITLGQVLNQFTSSLGTINSPGVASSIVGPALGLNGKSLPVINVSLDGVLHLAQDLLAPLQNSLDLFQGALGQLGGPDWQSLANALQNAGFTVVLPFTGKPDANGNLLEVNWGRSVNLPSVPLLVSGATGFSYLDDPGLFGAVNGSGQVSVSLTFGVDVNAQHQLGFFIAPASNVIQATLTGSTGGDGLGGSLQIGDLANVTASAAASLSITGKLGLQATAAETDGKLRAGDLLHSLSQVVTGSVDGAVQLDARFDAQMDGLPDIPWTGTFRIAVQNGAVQSPSFSLKEPSPSDLLGSLGKSLFSLGDGIPVLGPLSNLLNDPLPLIDQSVAQLTGLDKYLPTLPSLPANFGSLNGTYDVAGGKLTVNVTPATIDQFLHGQPVSLVSWEAAGDVKLIDLNLTIPIFSLGVPDIISAEIDATFGLHAALHYDVGFGLDGHGFWVRAGSAASPTLGLTFGVTAGVQGQVEVFGFPLAEAGGDIGFAITPYITLTAPPWAADPSKVYLSDLSLFGSNPFSDILDDLSVGIQGAFTGEVYASIDLFLFSISWDWGVSIPVFNFVRSPTWPTRSGPGSGGAPSLFDQHVTQSGGILTFTGMSGHNDNVNVSEGSDGSVTVNWAGVGKKTFTGVSEFDLVGNGGNERLTTAPGFAIPIKAQGGDDDYLQGGAGRDTLIAGPGKDTLVAGTGNDCLVGGAGTDLLIGGPGNDTLIAGTGTDTIMGGSGNSTIYGGPGADSIYAGSGNDLIQGGSGTYFIDGGSGSDTINAGSGLNDSIYGGTGGHNLITGSSAGHTLIYGGGPGDTLDGGLGGSDTIHGSAGGFPGAVTNNVIYGGARGHNLLFGGGAGDAVYGVNPANTVDAQGNPLSGVSGNNTIYGGNGNETLSGGDGQNLVFNPLANGLASAGGDNRSAGHNLLIAGPGKDVLYGDSTDPNTLQGGAGNDTLYAGIAGDFLQAGPAASALYGGPGPDSLQIPFTAVGQGLPQDTLVGGPGANTLVVRPPMTGTPSSPAAPTQLSAAITDTNATDTITVASTANIAINALLQVDSEVMQVTAVSGTSLTVTRGVKGTAIATHAAAAPVLILPQPPQAAAGNFRMYFNQVPGTNNQYQATLANLATGNTTTGSNTITILDGTAQLTVGQPVSGPGIPSGTTITAINSATSITISNNATATATGVPFVFGTVGQLSVTLPPDITNVALEGGPGDNWVQVDPSVTRNMYLYGGTGHNTLMAGSGSDTLVAGPGTGVLYGGTGDDFLYGGDLPSQDVPPQLSTAGHTTPRANPAEGHDTLIAGAGDSELFAGTGGDVLIGGSVARQVGPNGTPGLAALQNGQYQLIEGAGRDLLVGGTNPSASDLLIAGPGGPGAFLQAGAGNDVLVADNYGSNMLVGGSGKDLLLGGNLDNVMIGGSGNTTLAGGLGSDKLLAGSGSAVMYASYNATAWTQAAAAAAAAGVHLVPPQLLQGDALSAKIQALLVKQATGPLSTSDQQTLHDDLFQEFQSLFAQDSTLVAQITALENLFSTLTAAQKQQLESLYNQDILILQERIQVEQYLKSYDITAGDATTGPGGGFGTKMLIGVSGKEVFYGDPVLPTWMGGSGTFYNYHAGDTVSGGLGTDNRLILQGDGAISLSLDASNPNAVDVVIPGQNGGQPFMVGDGVGNISGVQIVGVQTGPGNDTVLVNVPTLPPGLTGLSVQCGSGNDLVDASAVTAPETLLAGSGSDTIKISANLATGSSILGSTTGSTELDIVDTVSNPVTVAGGALKVGSLSLNSQTGNTTSGSGTVTGLASTGLLAVGQTVSGPGIPAGTTIASILSNTSIALSANATATASGVSLVFGISFQRLVVIGGPGNNVFTTDGSIPNVVLKGGDGASNIFNITGPGNYNVIGGGPVSLPPPPALAGVTAPAPTGMSQATATLSQARPALAAATVGTKALFAGGDYSPDGAHLNSLSTVDIYDASTGQWSTATLSQTRDYLAAAAVGTKAVFAGGYTYDSTGYGDWSNAVDIYDASAPQGRQWSTATLSQPRWYLAAATVGTKAVFAGGTGPNNISNAVDIYDASTGQWSTATLSQARRHLAAAAVGTKAVFAGGDTGLPFKGTDAVDIYDASTGQWSTATLSQARTNLVAATVGTKAFFAGGNYPYLGMYAQPSNVMDIYDASTGQWSTATLPQARVYEAAVAVGTKAIFVSSGNVVDIYDASTGQWSTATVSQARYGLAATVVGTKALIAGGQLGSGGYSNVVDTFTLPPLVVVGTPSSSARSTAAVPYTLIDAASNPCSIQVQYSVNGGPWQAATAAAGGDGTSNLPSSPAGTAHTFVWDTAHDLGGTNNPSVQVRITPADAVGTGVTQAGGSFAVNNFAVTNTLNITFQDGNNDAVKLIQNGPTISFSGTAAGSPVAGTAWNMTSVSVAGGTGRNLLDASQMTMPVTLSGGNGSGPDTLYGGAASDTLYYSGIGSTYDGGGGVNNQIVYAANAGDNLAVMAPALVVNGAPRRLGNVSHIQGFRVSGSPASVNNGNQLVWPLDDYALAGATISGLTVAPNSALTALSARFTDPDPNASAGTDAATVDWGDGTTSAGSVASSGGGNFTVTASHIYATNAARPVTVTIIDNGGSAISAAAPYTGGLTLNAGTISNLSNATSTTVDSGVASYVARNADTTLFSLHTDGGLWAISGSGSKQQVDASVQSIMLAPDNTLFALHTNGDLYAGSPVTQIHFIESGERAILQDQNGTAYRLYTSGALYEMAAGSNWTQLKANVKSITLDQSGAAINVLTNDGNDYRFDGSAWTLLAGPHFAFTIAGTVTAGQTVPVTLAVLDYLNNPVLGYTGTVQFADSDAAAVAASGPPPQHTFAPADNGVFQFSLPFLTSGTQKLTAADGSGLTATASVTVNPGVAVVLSVDPPPVQVGSAAPVTVTAYDAYGNVVTGYTGTVKLSPTDPNAALPASYTFTSTSLTGNTTAGSATLTGLTSTANLAVGEAVTGPGIPAGVTVASIISGTSITLSGAATATASAVPLIFGDQGMHTFSPMFTKTGSQKLVAADTAGTGTAGAGNLLVTPAPVDLSQSTVSVTPTVVGAGGTAAVTLTARDRYGNQETGGGLTVAFSLAAGSVGGGNFSAVKDNQDGTYTATFTAGAVLGSDTITATINGQAITSSPASLAVVAGPPSPSKSTLAISPASVPAGGTATVAVTAVDAFGNVEPAGLPVVFGVGTGSAAGTFGIVTYAGSGVYTATFTGTTAGSNTITATVAGVTLTSTAPSVTVTPGPVSLATSSVSVTPASVPVGGTATVTLTARDAYGNREATGGLAVAFGLGTGSAGGTFGAVTDHGDGTYSATFTAGTTAGSNTVTATIGGQPITSSAPAVTVTAGAPSASLSTASVTPASIAAGGTATVTLTARDAYGNLEPAGLAVAFGLGGGTAGGTFGPVTYTGNGVYSATLTGTTAGGNTVLVSIGGQSFPVTAPSVTVTPGPVSLATSSVSVTPTIVPAGGGTATMTLTARDAYGNQESGGGLTVAFTLGAAGAGGTFDPVTDHGDGTYTTTFHATTAGSSTVSATIAGQALTSTPATLIIVPDEVHFSAPGYAVAENTGLAVVTLVRTGSVAGSATVQYATSDGTAKAGTDYTASSGTVTFAPGDLTQTFTIPVLQDHASDGAETVNLTLSNPAGTGLDGPASAVLSINDPLSQDPYPGKLPVVASILTHSDEAYTAFIVQAYQTYLKRAPDGPGLAAWLAAMRGGYPDEGLEAGFLSSTEYMADHGGTGAGWVKGMYQDLLGRPPDDAGLAAWVAALAGGLDPWHIAYGFAASREREGLRVGADYQIYLGRTLDPAGRDAWVNYFLQGARNEDVVAGLVGSAENYNNPNKGEGNRRAWIRQAFLDIFHRAAGAGEIDVWDAALQ